MKQFGGKAGPAGLVARSEAGIVVRMEIFVESDFILPVGIAEEVLLVGEVAPGFPVGAVVLAHRGPSPFTQVRAQEHPRFLAFFSQTDSGLFGCFLHSLG